LDSAASDAHAEDVHPPLVKIKKVGVDQTAQDILRYDNQANPVGEGFTQEEQDMSTPHCEQQDSAYKSPLDGHIEGLVVGIANCIGPFTLFALRGIRKDRFG